MSKKHSSSPAEELAAIIRSAERLGVEVDEEEALQWLAAMVTVRDDHVVFDVNSGVFGHTITMLDFSPVELERFRAIGELVGFEEREGVQTALALSGSAAQSKIQSYPGDCDYFERINIQAGTRDEACRILSELMREKALGTLRGDSYRLIEVKFGSYPQSVIVNEKEHSKGTPIAWKAQDIEAGEIAAHDLEGNPVTIRWEDVAAEPGWCKLDWIVIDPVRGQLANASNMIDATWEAPDGAILPLDGYLDPYFQEVYLEAESIPLFSKVAQHVSSDALDDYVAALEKEVRKHLFEAPNYGKAAKRMYNVFRLTGRYNEAAFLRELFDEPATILYQVWSLIRTLDDAVAHGSDFPMESVQAQADTLILSCVEALEGEEEKEIIRHLLRLKDALRDQTIGSELSTNAEAARAEVINLVNNFFHARLTAVPEIRRYIEAHQPIRDGA